MLGNRLSILSEEVIKMIKKKDKKLFEEMKIDCKRCFGLCCVALYFSASEGFPKDKEEGNDWNQTPENAEKMFEAFLIMRKLHEMKWYLTQAYCFQTNRSIKEEISLLIESIEQLTNLNDDSLLTLDLEIQIKAVNEFLGNTSESVRMKVRENEKENNLKIDRNSRKSDYFGADLRKIKRVKI